MKPLRLMTSLLVCLVCFLALPEDANAGPAASGSISSKDGAKGKGKSGGYDWPELVVGGNAISLGLPLQFGLVSYLPKGRFAFQYDRQIRKGHWIHVGAAVVFDRASHRNFNRNDNNCGLTASGDVCGKGGVVGFDVFAGYTHKFFIRDKPWLVPFARGTVGYSFFALPKIGGGDSDRLQTRTKSWTLNIKPGGGFRIFLLSDLGIGSDVNLPIGFLVHTDLPMGTTEEDKQGGFLLGIEVLPLVAEYRF